MLDIVIPNNFEIGNSGILTITDYPDIDLSEIFTIGNLIELRISKSMYCFTISWKNGAFRNICLHYSENNRSKVKEQAIELHLKIQTYLKNTEKGQQCDR
jgi:hypothetical protein